jgi:phenylalanyl-tRNA synthetase beta chain
VVDIGLFDVYRGAGLPDGKKSLAFRVLLQDTEKTLTDQEVEAVMGGLVRVLERDFSAKLRV